MSADALPIMGLLGALVVLMALAPGASGSPCETTVWRVVCWPRQVASPTASLAYAFAALTTGWFAVVAWRSTPGAPRGTTRDRRTRRS